MTRTDNARTQLLRVNARRWSTHMPRGAYILDNDKRQILFTGSIHACRVYRSVFGGVMRLERKGMK